MYQSKNQRNLVYEYIVIVVVVAVVLPKNHILVLQLLFENLKGAKLL